MESANPTFPTEVGQPARIQPFDGEQVARLTGGILGRRHFEDSLGGCSFTFRTRIENLARALGTPGAWVTEYLPEGRRAPRARQSPAGARSGRWQGGGRDRSGPAAGNGAFDLDLAHEGAGAAARELSTRFGAPGCSGWPRV